MAFTLPTIDQSEFTIDTLDEDMPVRGAFATDEPDLDRELEESIIERLNRGDTWAWCVVRVRAEFRGFTGEAYLGGCSYDGEREFTEEGGYYEDMKAEAFDRLVDNMTEIAQRLGCTEGK